jgi:hypothetical protein
MNKSWNHPKAPMVATLPQPSTFEQVVEQLNLLPHEYKGSVELREWARQNKEQKYVPTHLLKAWGFTVRGDLE